MLWYVCDNKMCNKVVKNETKIVKIEMHRQNNDISIHLCSDCANKLLDYLNIKTKLDSIKNSSNSIEVIENDNTNKVEEKDKSTEIRVSLRKKLEQYGVDRFLYEYKEGIKTPSELAEMLGVKLSSLKTFLYSNKILKRTYEIQKSDTKNDESETKEEKEEPEIEKEDTVTEKEEPKVEQEDTITEIEQPEIETENTEEEVKVTKEDKKAEVKEENTIERVTKTNQKSKEVAESSKVRVEQKHRPGRPRKNFNNGNKPVVKKTRSFITDVVNTTAKSEMQHLERQIQVTSGTCTRCAYKDKLDGICGYSILTGKSNNPSGGLCEHFIDVKELNND